MRTFGEYEDTHSWCPKTCFAITAVLQPRASRREPGAPTTRGSAQGHRRLHRCREGRRLGEGDVDLPIAWRVVLWECPSVCYLTTRASVSPISITL